MGVYNGINEANLAQRDPLALLGDLGGTLSSLASLESRANERRLRSSKVELEQGGVSDRLKSRENILKEDADAGKSSSFVEDVTTRTRTGQILGRAGKSDAIASEIRSGMKLDAVEDNIILLAQAEEAETISHQG